MLSALTSVFQCIRHSHDGRLLSLAGIVCAIGIYASFALAKHATRATPVMRTRWGIVCIISSGATAWATHFIILLAFKPGMPAAFDPWVTALSLLCAIAGIGAGISVAIRTLRPSLHFLSGLIVGVGVAALHYVGQAAYLVRGSISWNIWLVIPSIIASLPIAGLAMVVVAHRNRRFRVAAAPLLLFSIALLHFCGMAAMSLRSNPLAKFPQNAVSPEAITPVVAGVSILLIALAVLGWRFDVSAKARLRDDRRRLRELADVALEGLLICRGDEIVTANNSIERLADCAPGILVGSAISSLLPGVDIALLPEREERECELVAAHGDPVPVRVLRHEVALGHQLHTVVAVRDQRERLRTEATIRTLAFRDVLTGLTNRTRFFELLALQVSSRRTSDWPFSVLIVDLDRFKPINDIHGHAAGDAILASVAERLQAVIREKDVVARLGGDEFAIIQRSAGDNAGAEALASRILQAIAGRPFSINDQTIFLQASVGIAEAATDGADPMELMGQVDVALYAAKATSKGGFVRYDASLGEKMKVRRSLEAELRVAIEQGQLEVYYQPLVAAKTLSIVAAEALVRWNHPERGLIPPASFIDIAEETGLIVSLGEWVLETACREAVSWQDSISVAVNLSPAQFADCSLVDTIKSCIQKTGLNPNRLELEITEGLLLHDEERALSVLQDLRSLGVRISMDDFGTGYSSLSYLRKFPFDKIKIDQSFTRQLPDDAECAAIVRAILTMGSCLNISTTVEGVETKQQLDFCVSERCDTIQGYLVSKPLPGDNFKLMLSQKASCALAA